MSETVRRLSFAILVLLAVAVPFGLAPDKPDTDGYSEAVGSALVGAELNEDKASGAPQQAVVNGWVARDLLTIQAKQNNDMLTYQHTIATLLVVLIGALAWVGFAVSRSTRPDAESIADQHRTTDEQLVDRGMAAPAATTQARRPRRQGRRTAPTPNPT